MVNGMGVGPNAEGSTTGHGQEHGSWGAGLPSANAQFMLVGSVAIGQPPSRKPAPGEVESAILRVQPEPPLPALPPVARPAATPVAAASDLIPADRHSEAWPAIKEEDLSGNYTLAATALLPTVATQADLDAWLAAKHRGAGGGAVAAGGNAGKALPAGPEVTPTGRRSVLDSPYDMSGRPETDLADAAGGRSARRRLPYSAEPAPAAVHASATSGLEDRAASSAGASTSGRTGGAGVSGVVAAQSTGVAGLDDALSPLDWSNDTIRAVAQVCILGYSLLGALMNLLGQEETTLLEAEKFRFSKTLAVLLT